MAAHSTLTLAVGQATAAPRDIAANARTAADLVRLAADGGAALLLLPELFLSGYLLEDIPVLEHPEDDPRLAALTAACAETGTAAVVGAPVRGRNSALAISALVIDGHGRLAARYDKQHVTATEQAAGYTPGAEGCTLELDGWRLGLGICYDLNFPEHAREAAFDGCDAYLAGACFGTGGGARERAIVCPARALDNSCYLLFANHIGPAGPYTGCGGSGIWGPDGLPLAEAGEAAPGLVTATLDRAELERVRTAAPMVAELRATAPDTPSRTRARLDRPRVVGAAL